jgi:hypothetical protein
MALLQAAYSHNGLGTKYDGANDGFFRAVIATHRIAGPIIATCTRNDQAVGKAYPIASRLAGQAASALGDRSDRYGGIGRNGCLPACTPEAVDATLLPVTSAYQFQADKIYNLNADAIITGHSDIQKPEVAHAMLAAITST